MEGKLSENKQIQTKESSEKKYAEHNKFIAEVRKMAEEEIKASKPKPNSIEEILQSCPKFIKVLKKIK